MQGTVRIMTGLCLSAFLMVACSDRSRQTSEGRTGCQGTPSHIETGGTAGMGYHSEDGFLSKVSIQIGMHSRPRTSCPDQQSGPRFGGTVTLAQDN